jgi:23S rRNA pseudouridine1911/1915/1917 synthase
MSADQSVAPEKVEKRLYFVIPARQKRERLDKFLAQQISELSRARVQELIVAGHVTVDGKFVKVSHPVSPGETISVVVLKRAAPEMRAEDIPLQIVYEDADLAVIDKPAGMVVHPAFANYTGTLANALLFHFDKLSGASGEERPGIVHRLDKDTSGLLVVAKNDRVHALLADQFREKSAQREYAAIAWGHLQPRRGRVETYLRRSEKDRTRIVVDATQGRRAITNYEVIEQFAFASLVRLRLETGRTHQIRVHLTHLGHPVFGDPVYGGRSRQAASLSNKEQREQAAELLELMPRQALHARSLGFVHPRSEERLRFESPLPKDFELLLEKLRAGVSK